MGLLLCRSGSVSDFIVNDAFGSVQDIRMVFSVLLLLFTYCTISITSNLDIATQCAADFNVTCMCFLWILISQFQLTFMVFKQASSLFGFTAVKYIFDTQHLFTLQQFNCINWYLLNQLILLTFRCPFKYLKS